MASFASNKIPKIIHQIWIGDKPAPTKFMDTWRDKNPDFEYIRWNEEEFIKRDFKIELKEKIDSGILIDRDSIEEIEIRSTSIYVTAKLTELINNYKNKEEKILIPQLDFKLWTDFHADERPHHLTKTIMY